MKFSDIEHLINASETDCLQATQQSAAPNHVPSLPEKINLLELKKTFTELKSIIGKHPARDNETVLSAALIQDLIQFMKTRDARVTRYGLGYTATPQSIANLLCKNIAVGILQQQGMGAFPNRDLYRLLMPSLNITGSITPCKDAAPEESDLPDYGTFLLSDTLLKTGIGPIINFKKIINYCSTHLFFFAYLLHTPNKAELVRQNSKFNRKLKNIEMDPEAILSPHEKNRFRNFNSLGKAFLFQKDLQLKTILLDATLKNQLETLAMGLSEGGSGKGGREYNAGPSANEAIAIFMDFFNALSQDVQKKLKTLKGIDNPRSLGEIIQIIQEPPDVYTSTKSCTNANSSILRTIADNPANADLLNIKVEHLGDHLEADLVYDDTKSPTEGKDSLKNYSFELVSPLFIEITYWENCITFINFCQINPENASQFSVLREQFYQFFKQAPARISDRFHDIEQPEWCSFIYQRIKADLPLQWELSALRTFLLKLPPEEIKEELLRITDHSHSIVVNVRTLNELLTMFSEEQANAICASIHTFKAFRINNIFELNEILKHRTPQQSARIFSILKENNVLQRYVRNAQDIQSLLHGVQSPVIAAIIGMIFTPQLITSINDIKAIFDTTQIDQATSLSMLTPMKPFLLSFARDLHLFSVFISNFSQKTQLIISHLLKEELLAMINSATAFCRACTTMSTAQRDFVYNHLQAKGICNLITNLEEFYRIMALLEIWQRNEVYSLIQDHLSSWINSANDLYKALYFLSESCRSDFFQKNKPKLLAYFDLRVLKLFTQSQAHELIAERVFDGWHLSQPSLTHCFKEILNLIPDDKRLEMYQQIGPDNLIASIITAEDFFNVAVFLPAQTQSELYETMRDKLSSLIKTPQDFKFILEVTPVGKVADFFKLCRPILLTVFKTTTDLKLLQSNQAQYRMFSNLLDNLLKNRFISIYNALLDLETFVEKFFVRPPSYSSHQVWTYFDTYRGARVLRALEIALQDLTGEGLVQTVYDKTIVTHSMLPFFNHSQSSTVQPRDPGRMAHIQSLLNLR
jgi:hypothetical protein